jgi:hypothetical protein
VLIAERLRPEDRLVACELRPDDHGRLHAALAPAGPRARALQANGYEELTAIAGRRPGRLFALIDPPFERADDYVRLAQAAEETLDAVPHACLLIWTPLKDLETFDACVLCCDAAKPSHRLYEREIRMSVHEPTPFRAAIPSVDADRAVKFGMGVAAAPLWATFFTAASAGMAYWWMAAAWTRREPNSFAPAKSTAQMEARSPAPVRTAEPAPGEPLAAPTLVVVAPAAPAVEAQAAPRAAEPERLAAASPVAAAVEPAEIAALVEAAKPVQTAPRANGARAETPAAAPRKPPVRRRPEPKA